MPQRDAASPADELDHRLADVEAILTAARARIDVLERALAAAGVPVPAEAGDAAASATGGTTAGQGDASPTPAAAQSAAATPPAGQAKATQAGPADQQAADAALAAADAGGADAPAADAAAGDPPAAADPDADDRDPALVARIEDQRRALYKRGFRRDDVFYHPCASCGVQAVEKYAISGKSGGRDIDLCLACGVSSSWRRRPEKEDRERDTTFDLATFLR